MKRLILSAVAMVAALTPALASAQVQRAVATGQDAQLIRVDDDDRRGRRHGRGDWRGEHRREWREHRREHRRDWRDDRRHYRDGYRDGRRSHNYYTPPARYYYAPPAYGYYRPGYSYHAPRYHRGGYLPHGYGRYVVRDYYNYGWAPPPPGYAYYRTDTGDIILAAIATGLILSIIAGNW
jgi:Ni/Co efflux regulator RcnB